MAFGNEIRAGSSGQSTGFYNGITSSSARIDEAATSYLSRTPSSAGNRRTFTFATWFKGHTNGYFFSALKGSNNDTIGISGSNEIQVSIDNASSYSLTSSKLIRDPNAWYHLVWRVDSTQSTNSNRMRVYLNGNQITGWSTENYVSQDYDFEVNNTVAHNIGRLVGGTTGYVGGYITETHLIDGQSLGPESFGETKNGIWIPKNTSGLTYGTNGFRLQFKQTGTGTASSSTIGADTSGQDNHYTSNNMGADDSNIPDCPENNFATLNPRFRAVTANTLSEGNLKCVTSTSGRSFNAGSFLLRRGTGKWWWEYRVNDAAAGMGVARVNGKSGVGAYQSVTSTSTGGRTTDYYYGANNWGTYQHTIAHNGSVVTTLSGSASYPEVYGVLVDTDTSSPNLEYYVNGSAVGNVDLDLQYDFIPIVGDGSGGVSRTIDINFGQNPTFNGNETAGSNTDSEGFGLFSQAVPSGAKCLCSSNLPDLTIGPDSDNVAEDFMNTIEYTSDNIGAGGTQNVTGVGFQPDWVWIKNLSSNSTSHTIYDSNRGTGRHISSDNTSAEVGPNSIYGYLSAFGADGFTLTGGTTNANYINQSTDVYVAWNWKANGGTTTTNDASATGVGSIDSVIQANTAAGFSIVSYTGTGSEAQIAHGLNQAPEYVIIKNRSTSSNGQWVIGDNQSGFTSQMYFDQGAASTNAGSFGDTAPNATVVNVNTDNTTNESGDDFIMYCFHSVEGYSKIGKWVGNAVADGPFVYTGFRPQWILIKDYSAGSRDWTIVDDTRFGVGQTNQRPNPIISNINPNDTNKEFDSVSYPMIDFLSNGFKVVIGGTGSTIAQNLNKSSSNSYLYLAFADSPTKFANGF